MKSKTTPTTLEEELMTTETVEKLAAYAHEAWSGWMKYLFNQSEQTGVGVIVPTGLADRWHRQMNTAYADLPEKEKESDRAEADKMLAIMEEGK
jgi:hypothetical protein